MNCLSHVLTVRSTLPDQYSYVGVCVCELSWLHRYLNVLPWVTAGENCIYPEVGFLKHNDTGIRPRKRGDTFIQIFRQAETKIRAKKCSKTHTSLRPSRLALPAYVQVVLVLLYFTKRLPCMSIDSMGFIWEFFGWQIDIGLWKNRRYDCRIFLQCFQGIYWDGRMCVIQSAQMYCFKKIGSGFTSFFSSSSEVSLLFFFRFCSI